MSLPPDPSVSPEVVAVTANPPSEPETTMLDVHPPHHAANNWRDFFIHIATIVIGLLIAIGLEQAVEYMHHRHIVAESRENIRHEIELNREQIRKDLQYIHEDGERMKSNLDTIRAMRTDARNFHGALHYTMSWSSLNESAWRSSRDMGALSYMPYPEVQGYADLYGQQELVNQTAVSLFTRQSMAATPVYMEKDFTRLPDSETLLLLRETSSVFIGLQTLEEMLQQLAASYDETLKK